MQHRQAPKPPPSDLDDTDLVRRALLRDENAYRTIMQRYNGRLYRIARGILLNNSDAEDVVQDAYIRAFTHLGTFRGDSSLGTWLIRIVMNEALMRKRRERPKTDWATWEDKMISGDVIPFSQGPAAETPERNLAQQELRRLVEIAVDDLPEKYRLVLVARAIEEMSIEETADLLDLSTETVKVRLHRARALLRSHVEKQVGPILLETFPFGGNSCRRVTQAGPEAIGPLAKDFL